MLCQISGRLRRALVSTVVETLVPDFLRPNSRYQNNGLRNNYSLNRQNCMKTIENTELEGKRENEPRDIEHVQC